MLLCRCESRGGSRSHQERYYRCAITIQSYVVFLSFFIGAAKEDLEEQYNVKSFPSDNSKLAEMEFYLVDDLECDLIVFHPYRTLLTLCRKESSDDPSLHEAEAGEVGIGIDDGPRYWGTGEGQLELSEGALQTAWFVSQFYSERKVIYLLIGS
jgi:hypothetical protein